MVRVNPPPPGDQPAAGDAAFRRPEGVLERRTHRTWAAVPVLLAGVVLIAGCGTSASGPSAAAATPTLPSWVTAPRLPSCPAGASTSGTQLPAVTLRCLDGRSSLALDHLRSGPYVINLWASWCEPCRAEAPRLAAAAAAAGGRVQFLGVDTADGRDPALSFLHDFGIAYPQLADPNSDVLHRLPAPGLPVTLAVDASGRVAYRRIGEISADQLAAAVHAVDPSAAVPAGATG